MVFLTTERVPVRGMEGVNERIREMMERNVLCSAAGGNEAITRRIAGARSRMGYGSGVGGQRRGGLYCGCDAGHHREPKVVCTSCDRGRLLAPIRDRRLVSAGFDLAAAGVSDADRDRKRTIRVKGASRGLPRGAGTRRSFSRRRRSNQRGKSLSRAADLSLQAPLAGCLPRRLVILFDGPRQLLSATLGQ